MFFDRWSDLLRVAVVATLAYAWLVLVLRVVGKRALSKLNAFDFVVTVALGSTLATVLLSEDVSLAEGALAFAMLALLQYVISRLSVGSSWFKRLVRSEPALLVRDGQIFERALMRERVTRSDVESAIRNHGIGNLAEVGAVVLETDGSFSVIRRDPQGYELLTSVKSPG